jgi:Putative Ig domain.
VNVLDLAPAAGALPDATFGTAYNQAVTASGGSGGFTYAVTAGSLPEGLTLNAATGALTGTPGGALGTGSFSFTVTATNTATTCTIAKAYTLVSRPVAVLDTYTNGAGNTEYYGGGYAPTPTTPFVASATNILSNDLGPGLTVTSLTQPANGTVTLGTAGAFRYTPNEGAETSATFTYKVTSNGVESQAAANVTITLVGQVWYVNSSVANGIGTSNSPFNNLANADVSSGAGDVVFVHTGAATTTGAITLDANQVLWGQGAAFSLGGSGSRSAPPASRRSPERSRSAGAPSSSAPSTSPRPEPWASRTTRPARSPALPSRTTSRSRRRTPRPSTSQASPRAPRGSRSRA